MRRGGCILSSNLLNGTHIVLALCSVNEDKSQSFICLHSRDCCCSALAALTPQRLYVPLLDRKPNIIIHPPPVSLQCLWSMEVYPPFRGKVIRCVWTSSQFIKQQGSPQWNHTSHLQLPQRSNAAHVFVSLFIFFPDYDDIRTHSHVPSPHYKHLHYFLTWI